MARVFRSFMVAVALVAPVVAWMPEAKAELPVPSVYPTTWQLKFEYGRPKRIVVNVPGKTTPQAYWYMPFSVTNTTDQERMYFPVFEMVTEDGQVLRSDKAIPTAVVNEVRKQTGNRFLQPLLQTAGELRLGEDETKHSAAIWAEPTARMGHFSILVSGLSGETAKVKSAKGEDVLLRKTLQLNFIVRGDEVYPGEDEVNENASTWIMR
jgi:hypothetical protein